MEAKNKMKRKHAKAAAKKLIKIAKKHPDYYSSGDVIYARLLLSRLKKEKHNIKLQITK